VEEGGKIHAIKTIVANSGFHMKQALTMKRSLSVHVDDEDLDGFLCLLLCALTDNFILLKYFLSEEFASMWSHNEMDKLVTAMLKVGETRGLICLISSPSFIHFYESKSLLQRQELNKKIMTECKYSEKDFNLNSLGDNFCNQPYVPIFLIHLIRDFKAKKLFGNFENFLKASMNVNEYQLELLSREEEFRAELVRFMSYMQIQNTQDEYAKHGMELKAKIEKIANIKDHDFSRRALEDQSVIGEEEGAGQKQSQLEASAMKSHGKYKEMQFTQLAGLLLEHKEQEAIAFVKRFKPSNIFNFS